LITSPSSPVTGSAGMDYKGDRKINTP